MKSILKTISGAVLGIVLFSCSNEGDDYRDDDERGNVEAASIVLKLSNDVVMNTRSMDDIQSDNTQNILQVTGTVNLFFFTATGGLVKADTPTASELSAGKTYTFEDDGITTAVTEVVVIGNTGNIATGVTNKTSLHAKMSTLENAQTDYMKSTPDIWVYGSTTDIDWDAQPALGGVKQGECSIDMAPVLSRIDVTVNTSGITAGYIPADIASSNIEFNGVAVLYSGGYSHYIPSFVPGLSTLKATYGESVLPLRSGLIHDSFPLWEGTNQVTLLTPVDNESILHASWDGEWNGNSNLNASKETFTRSFYAFPSSMETGFYNRNTIVTVYGNHYTEPGTDDNITTPLFWAVQFSETQALKGGSYAKPLENGNLYKLMINMNGDFSNGGSGTTDPDKDYEPADLEVTINQVKWKTVISMEIDFES